MEMPPTDVVIHEACVARIPRAVSDRKSALLVARALGYLVVRVMFHGRPVAGLEVRLGLLTAPTIGTDDEEPEAMPPVLTTNAEGLVTFPRLVPTGFYGCLIAKQPWTVVHTTPTLGAPFIVPLPVGRPLVDIGDVDEFLARAAPEV